MDFEQKHMDAYTSGATRGGEINWAEREDNKGVAAVLSIIDPAPADATILVDGEGSEWVRNNEDPMMWYSVFPHGSLARTAVYIIEKWGLKEWS